MPVEVRVPQLGESVVEATVGSWLKREGEQVAAGEPLVQLETEKVNVEVAAERAGVLERIAHQEGDTVAPGDVLATLEDGAAETPTPPAIEQPSPWPSPRGRGDADGPASPNGGAPRVSPEARRLAEERNVDLSKVTGTGPAGRIMAADVEQAIAQPAAAPAPPPAAQPPA